MRITRIGATPLLLPFREPYYWAGRCDLDAVVVLVEVETDEGISGFAEVTGGYPPAATEAALGEIAQLFVGRSPFDIAGLCAEAYHIYGLSQAGNFANLIVGAVEMALFDIMGKALDQPVHSLLGGACRDEVDYFAFVHGRTADELVEDARTWPQYAPRSATESCVWTPTEPGACTRPSTCYACWPASSRSGSSNPRTRKAWLH
jgi:L-alanine-DL-glutamate epimerase-like enolase superfamily enzyme